MKYPDETYVKYGYDAFGGLYTGITQPYNTNTFAGKSYDPKANLIDNNARWYQAQNGRFTTADPYRGEMLTPYTQNRYAYVGNNPINRWDPLGYWEDGDEDLSEEAQEKIREYTRDWENAKTDKEREDAHNAAEEVRRQEREGSGSSGGSDDSGDTGGSGSSGGGSNDDDDDDYYRPPTAKEVYQSNKTVLNQYSKPQTQVKTAYSSTAVKSIAGMAFSLANKDTSSKLTTANNVSAVSKSSISLGYNYNKLSILSAAEYKSTAAASKAMISSGPSAYKPTAASTITQKTAVQKASAAAKVLNGVQLALDVVGLIPGAGEVADGVNALISLARGDKVGAAISAAAMIPLAGAAATGGKLIKKGVQALGSVVAPVVASSAKKVISTVASVAAPIAKKAISTATNAVKKAVSTATTAVKNTAAAAISSVKSAASNFVSEVKGLVGGLFKKSAPAPASSKIDLQLFGGNKAAKGTGNAVKDNMKTKVPNQSVNPPAKRGNAPISKQDGKPIEIHHEGQNPNGPFHEMSRTDHRGGDNYQKNHPNLGQPSQINRNGFNKQKTDYWKGEWDSGRWGK